MGFVIAALVAILALATAVVVLLRRRLMVVRVNGPSMTPTLQDGERVLARRTQPGTVPARGDIVVLVDREHDGHLVKRITALAGDPEPGDAARVVPPDHLWLEGDGENSFDSRHFGAVPAARVVGIVRRDPPRATDA